MTDVIVSHLVESPAVTYGPGQKDYADGRAVIHYDSMLDAADVTITATSEADNYEAVNVKSRFSYNGWMPDASGTQYLTFTGLEGHTADCLTIAAHNLASKGATIDLEYYDGSSWTSAMGGYAPSSDSPFMVLFTSQSRLAFRLVVNVAGANYPFIGVVLLGQRLALQRGIYVGHNPAPYSPDVDFLTEESDGGNIIGSVVYSEMFTSGISLHKMTPDWFRAYLKPFLVKARRKIPFAFMWNTDDRYKGEVIYGTLMNKPSFGNEHQSFMGGDLEMRGLA